jgi:DNA-binding MarR family transcriptional regulator
MTRSTNSSRDLDRATDAAVGASRALVAVAARSIAELEDVTLPQFRALVILASRGPRSSGELASMLGVHPSTLTRLVDRLAAKDLVTRSTPSDRREVVVAIAARGVEALRTVTEARRREVRDVMKRVPPDRRAAVAEAFAQFADAAGEVPENEWAVVLSPPEPPT